MIPHGIRIGKDGVSFFEVLRWRHSSGSDNIAHNDEIKRKTLDELLQLSEALQQRSDALAAEAEQLRSRISELIHGDGSPRTERRKKPRLKGK